MARSKRCGSCPYRKRERRRGPFRFGPYCFIKGWQEPCIMFGSSALSTCPRYQKDDEYTAQRMAEEELDESKEDPDAQF